MLLYAGTIRDYWAIVAVLYATWRILLPRLRGLLSVLLIMVAALAAMQIAFTVVLNKPLTFARAEVNAVRASINVPVGSLITDFLPNSPSLEVLNALLIGLSLIAPWPLLVGGSLSYLLAGFLLLTLWGRVLFSVQRLQRERRVAAGLLARESIDCRGWLSERNPRPVRSVALLLAVLVVQAIFEPDYGSYLKHLAPLLPLFLSLVIPVPPIRIRGDDRAIVPTAPPEEDG